VKHGWGGGAALEIMITCEGKLVQLILKQWELWCVAPRWSRVLHLGPWMSRFMENKVWQLVQIHLTQEEPLCVCVCVCVCVCCDDPGPSGCRFPASLHSGLQLAAGHQLHLLGAAAVDLLQGVGSQVGHQQLGAPVQQVEHVLRQTLHRRVTHFVQVKHVLQEVQDLILKERGHAFRTGVSGYWDRSGRYVLYF